MIRTVFVLLVLAYPGVCQAQRAEVVKLEKLQNLMRAGESIQVFNFWATWCAPCVKEMPLLEKMNRERKDVQVTLVSMDIDLDPDPEKVQKFIARKKIQSRVLILDEQNPNAWISKIDKAWSGALPATMIINGANGKRKFIERELHEGELEKLIEEVK
jgi:thiol-disulfide isomerase/thioredoxin